MYDFLNTAKYELRSKPGTLVGVVEECPFQAGIMNSVEHANELLNEVRLCRNAMRRNSVLGDHKYRMFPIDGYDYAPQEIQDLINVISKRPKYNKLYDRVFLRSCLWDIFYLLHEQEPKDPPRWEPQAREIAYNIQQTIQKLGGECDIIVKPRTQFVKPRTQ